VLGAACSRNSIVRCCTWVFIFIPCLYDEVFESAGILGNSYGYRPVEKMKIIIIIIINYVYIGKKIKEW
jgi:hypothetical protein